MARFMARLQVLDQPGNALGLTSLNCGLRDRDQESGPMPRVSQVQGSLEGAVALAQADIGMAYLSQHQTFERRMRNPLGQLDGLVQHRQRGRLLAGVGQRAGDLGHHPGARRCSPRSLGDSEGVGVLPTPDMLKGDVG